MDDHAQSSPTPPPLPPPAAPGTPPRGAEGLPAVAPSPAVSPNPPIVQPGPSTAPPAQWEPITPNIQITPSHLFAYGTVVPLTGSEWHATTTGTTTRTVPPWAIVLCIVFFLACFLGLLFLAVKEEKFRGEVTVTVRDADGKSWSESVPMNDVAARDQLMRRVGWAQTMTSHAGSAGR